MKRLLMIAFHFPPLTGSSGIQRTLSFARQLPEFGWDPMVLTSNPRAYPQVSEDLARGLPAALRVTRAFALDASRHLALAGRYPGWLARPDRWTSWLLGAVPAGLAIIRRERPAAIWSTYPIPTAHLIGSILARMSGLPWIADFRDPMAHEGYPEDPATWRSYLRTERQVFARANRMVFTTPGAAEFYRARYPERAAEVRLIENGYDEDAFARAELRPARPLNPGQVTILHSGIVYPEWRNPSALFGALQQMLDSGQLNRDTLRLRFRAPVHDAWLHSLAHNFGLDELVQVLPPIPYQQALEEMLAADALLALQSHDCADQVPAKVYEYLRARKPILGLADPGGDTGALLRRAEAGPVCALEDQEGILRSIKELLACLTAGANGSHDKALIEAASRRGRTQALAELLHETVTPATAFPPTRCL